MKKLLLLIGILFTFSSCTENNAVKNLGGTATIELPPGEKLIVVTWKDNDLWYLSRARRTNEPIESYQFKEKSSYGLLNGTYFINEK